MIEAARSHSDSLPGLGIYPPLDAHAPEFAEIWRNHVATVDDRSNMAVLQVMNSRPASQVPNWNSCNISDYYLGIQ
jgi:hypothetical protein